MGKLFPAFLWESGTSWLKGGGGGGGGGGGWL